MKPVKYLLFSLWLCSTSLVAQKTGSLYLPPLTEETPAFFKVFYNADFPSGVNVFQLDAAASLYKKELKRASRNQGEQIKTDIDSGEEQEGIYLLYYIRWRKSVDRFIQSDGTLLITSQPDTSEGPSLVTQARSPNSQWSLIGPVTTYWTSYEDPAQTQSPCQINIYSCAIAPSNTNILYAAAETGGVYKTSDNGQNWSYVLDEWATFTALAVDPANPSIVYAGHWGAIEKTTNGGGSWTTVSFSCGEVNAIAVSPSNTNTIFAATENGLFMSTNGGTSWAIAGGMNTTVYDVWLKVNDPNTVFILKKNGSFIEFLKSTDGGNTFAISMNGWTPVHGGGARMTVTAADANRLYVVVLADAPSPPVPHIFRSNDGGQNWSLQCLGQSNALGMDNWQGYYDLAILANPNNANDVLVGTGSAYKSTDGGSTFNHIGGYGGSFNIHPDIQWMSAVGNHTWIATDGAMNYSSDFFTNTANFSTRNTGLFGSDFWGFTQGWNEDLMAGGRYHNGNTVIGENYSYPNAMRLGGAEAGTGYYMIGRPRHIAFSDISDLIVPNTFSGPTGWFSFNKYPNEGGYGFDAGDVEFLPYCYNTVFLGSGTEFWKSSNGGLSWTSLHNFNENPKHFKISRSNPDVIYLNTDYNFYKSVDGGNNWTQLSLPPGVSHYNLEVVIDFTDENTLWICSPGNSSNNRVFKSVNGGSSWINLTTPTIDGQAYRNIVHQAGTNGGVYILGIKGKVYYRNNTMSDWADFSASLPIGSGPVRSIPFYRDGKLRTGGCRGIWQVDFYEDGLPVAQPTVDKLSSECPRDTFYFEDYSALKHAGASWNWSFSPAPAYVSSATARNPKVVFGASGIYDFTLTVSNSAGSSTKTVSGKIVISGNACGPDTVPGKLLELQNPGDYAEMQQPLGITTNTITLSCWIKPNGIQMSYAGILFSGSGGACGLNFQSNNRIGYHWNDTPPSYNWGGGPTVPANVWSHLALVITPTSATIYLNGVAYTHTNTNVPVNFDQLIQFGIDRGSTTRNFIGQMDEVCIYNRALSQDEIRELMNLTRNNPNPGSLPVTDNSLIAYYQFNEGNAFPVYDKVGLNHAYLAGATATKNTISTAPVGGGTFQRMAVNAAGTYSFTTPGVEVVCPANATYPGGDVVVSRLNVPSDQLCYPNILPAPGSYYVIRNYGINPTFTNLASIRFSSVQGTSAGMTSVPQSLKLYARGANADGAVWTMSDSADVVTDNNGTGTVTFSTGLQLTDFGQFSVANYGAITTELVDNNQPAVDITLQPNPSNTGWVTLGMKSSQPVENACITIYDDMGRLIKRFYLKSGDLQQPVHFYISDTAGMYYVNVYTETGKATTTKVIIE